MTTPTATNGAIKSQSAADKIAWEFYIRSGRGQPNTSFLAPNGGTIVIGGEGKMLAVIPHNVNIDGKNTDPYVALFDEAITEAQREWADEHDMDPDAPETAWSQYQALAHKTPDEKFLYTIGNTPHALLVGTGTRFAEQITASGAITGGTTEDPVVNTELLTAVLDKIREENRTEIEFLTQEIPSEQTAALARYDACRAAIALAAIAGKSGEPVELEKAVPVADDEARGVSTSTQRFDAPTPGDHTAAVDVPMAVVNSIVARAEGVVFTRTPTGEPHVAVRDYKAGRWQRFVGEVGTEWHRFVPAVERFFVNNPHIAQRKG